ncbi:MAG: ABC transporter ATP-binding protein [Halobaculum sp.]
MSEQVNATVTEAAQSGETAVSVDGLQKEFGDVRALDGVDLTVGTGEVFGLVGPNGAGKSTTLRTLATLLTPTAGTAEVFGVSVAEAPETVRRLIRYLPEEAGAYDSLTGRDYLQFVANVYVAGGAVGATPTETEPANGAGEESVSDVVGRGVEIAALGDRIDDDIGEYSKGMTRKLLVASVLMTRPRLAILDEPTDGLDVRNARAVREEIETYPDERRALVVSSHDLLEVGYLCDRVALLNEGRVAAVGTPDELTAEFGGDNLEEAFLEATA